MPEKRIPLANQESGQERLGGASPAVINVVTDDKGTIRRRPGIQNYSGAPSTAIDTNGIEGLHVSNQGSLYAVGGVQSTLAPASANRIIYRVAAGGATDIGLSSTVLDGFGRPVFAETEMLVVIAGASSPIKIEKLNGDATSVLANAPNATHFLANSSRLLADASIESEFAVQYSGTFGGITDFSGAEVWTLTGIGTSGFFKAEAKADPIVALATNLNEVWVWGPRTLQVFVPDAQLVYASAASREFGLSAPYSVVKIDNQFAWLDERRRFILSDGRESRVLSDAIQQDLDDMATVDDCFGFRYHQGYADVLVWKFPTDGRTYAFQMGHGWGQWHGFSSGQWQPWKVNCHHRSTKDAANLVGTTDGFVGVLQNQVVDDLGETIVATVESGFVDHGTSMLKMSEAVYVDLERGTTTDTVEPLGWLQFADEPDRWSDKIPVSAGINNDRWPSVPLYSLGTYRRRAWRFIFSEDENLSLVGIREKYSVLEV